MVAIESIIIEVAYATAQAQHIITIEMSQGSIIAEAIDRSGILQIFPEIDLTKQKVGIFSHQKKLTDLLAAGDRIEIYRALITDPKEARRKRAKRYRAVMNTYRR
jgi:putative ubiquitin-RnfH superfamily antitoxin RatB of RatAB toxin-antitoxin module